MTLWDFLGIKWFKDLKESVQRIEEKVDMSLTYQESKQEWVDYTTALQEENAALRSALEEAASTAEANAQALQDFQDNDAVTDAQQLADQEKAFAEDLHNTLEGIKPAPAEPEPLPEEPSGPTTAPEGEEPQVNPL